MISLPATAEHDAICRRAVARRKDLGLTQQDVADRMGIGFQAVSKMERGVRDPTTGTLVRWAEALRVSYPYLAAGMEPVAAAATADRREAVAA